MKYLEITDGEFNSLKELAHRAKMDWFTNGVLSKTHKISTFTLDDLKCGFLKENIELMTNVDLITCYKIFVKADLCDAIVDEELFKLFKERKVYSKGMLTNS